MNDISNYLYNNGYILIFLYLVIINTSVFVLCGIDKIRASNKAWRIRERTLYLLSFIGGAFFMLLGMLIFRHKTNKPGFAILIPLFLLLHLILLLLIEVKFGFLSKLIS